MNTTSFSPISVRGPFLKACSGAVVLLIVVTVLTGCPWLRPRTFEFTSADVSGTGLGRVNFDGAGAPTEGDAAEGEGEPVREVVEPDVIRRAGGLLYILNQYRGLSIVDLEGESIIAQLPTIGLPRDLYVVGDRAYVLVGGVQQFMALAETGRIGASNESKLYVVDVSVPSNAAIIGSFTLNGDLVDSRLVGEVLYAVSAQFNYFYEGDGTDGGTVDGDKPEIIRKQASDTWVTSIDVSDPHDIREADRLTFAGQGNVIQVTPEALFVAAYDYRTDSTGITYIDITDPAGIMAEVGQMTVRGNVADRFKMDVWNGALRVVSSAWADGRQVYVSTFDLATLAPLDELRVEGAEGETLFATRFDGDRGYVVTFFVIDPLFVIDLSDPEDLRVLGALEVPGYSTHIEPRGDRLIALGVDDTTGWHVSLSIFDVSGPPALVDRVTFGEGWSWSNAFHDVKALTVLDDVILVPFAGWSEHFGGYERLQFVSYSPDDLELRGFVDLQGTILRSFEHGGRFYGVTTEQLAVINGDDLDKPAVESTVTLAENVADFAEVSSDLGVAIVSRTSDGLTVVRTVDGNQATLGEVVVDVGYYDSVYVEGTTAAVVGVAWDEHGGEYKVAVINLAAPEAPALRGIVTVDVDPYYGGYWWGRGYYGPEVDVAAGAKSVIGWWPPYYGNFTKAFLLDSTLVLRGFGAESDTDLTFGPAAPREVLALVDLESAAWTSTIGLGYDGIVSLDAVGDKLYLGTRQDAGFDLARPVVAYFIRELDVLNRVEGPPANVPGEFVHYDPGTDVLTLRDYQWDPEAFIRTTITTVRWDGFAVTAVLDELAMPPNSGRLIAAGERLYYDFYGAGYGLGAIEVSGGGQLRLGASVIVSETAWAYLLGAKGDDVIVSVGGSGVARYEFGEDAALADLIQVMGYPWTVRFGEARAYLPMGYFGLVSLPLD